MSVLEYLLMQEKDSKASEYKSLDQLVSSIFLFQLKLDSLPGHYFFTDFDWVSRALELNFIG